jgi:hypothetical protein
MTCFVERVEVQVLVDTSIVFSIFDAPDSSFLLRLQFGWSYLHYAAYYGLKDIVCQLLERGADVNPVAKV